MDNVLYKKCLLKAEYLTSRGCQLNGMDLWEIADLIYKLEIEKQERDEKSDKLIDYNDEIVSIEHVGDKETIDISVSGDNLFYCSNILTKNSFGLPATTDLMLALISTDELEDAEQILFKQLKNRYNDLNKFKRFVVGIDKSRMRLYDVEEEAQEDIMPEIKEIIKTTKEKGQESLFSDFKF